MKMILLCVLICVSAIGSWTGRAAEAAYLWAIGEPDEKAGEFALGPDAFRKFQTDGFFLVGTSESQQDWPYVHPGPEDSWAGSRPHTFAVIFGLQPFTNHGPCRLQVKLLDTHSSNPPILDIEINGHRFEQKLPQGAGDDSLQGHPEKGRRHAFGVEFPARLLRTGENQILITSRSGSWLVYDWLGLEAPEGLQTVPVTTRTFLLGAQAIPALRRSEDKLLQPVQVSLRHRGDDVLATVAVETGVPLTLRLTNGVQTVELGVPEVAQEQRVKATLMLGDRPAASREVTLKPVRKQTIYVLPHSHTDIGYTDVQSAIEAKQVENLRQGMAIARQTAQYPEGARFVWNVEVLWAADLFLRRLPAAERLAFIEAVQSGQVALCGMYLNELTGLCRPEELLRLFRFATKLADYTRVPIDAVMISDVPGYTWGTVPAMAQAGLKYFSTAPNYFDRIGTILQEWENKPFYWVGPDNRSKVLVWIPSRGYALSHIIRKFSPEFVADFQATLERTGYPYDIAHVRWSGHGDNAVPDAEICEFIKDWNTRYEWPKFIISSVSQAFRAFEERYGDQLPEVRGDWTPYWEDGAGSSSAETAMNRASADRLAQAETLFALRQPRSYPATAFEEAWNRVLLYSEHTWGAWCSISGPERQETTDQWAIKQGYALEADRRSRELLAQSLAPGNPPPVAGAVDVFNTLSWERTGLVTLSPVLSAAGDLVRDDNGRPVPSQRLATGELVFLAQQIPPFAARRFRVGPGPSWVTDTVRVRGTTLENDRLRVRLDEITGGIAEWSVTNLTRNLVDTRRGETINDYLYLVGDNPADVKRNGPVTILVGENGPLVASLIVTSEAPGCHQLRREIRLAAGSEVIELINTVDKQRLVATNYFANSGKESVNFAFPFNVPQGQIRLDIPFGVIRPELDQMPSACKNWFTVGRWADVSDERHGVTWVTLDAPLVQVGGLTATLLNSQYNPAVWRNRVERTQRLYSWAMNNHWGTNYRAYQEGKVIFRFLLRAHGAYDPVAATRFGMEQSFTLLPVAACAPQPPSEPRLRINSPDVLVTGLKPSDDGQALILRLFGASGASERSRVQWIHPGATDVFFTDTSEKPIHKAGPVVEVPGYGIVGLRAVLPR